MADSAAPDTSDMLVFNACCCCNALIWTDTAKFIGCSGVSECLCIKEEFCCKANTPQMPIVLGAAEGFICKLGLPCCSCGLKVPTIILKGKSQCLCIVGNAAFPPDEDTPMMFALYGLTCFPVQGCCMALKDVAPKGAAAQNTA